jgi:hypothetical protein
VSANPERQEVELVVTRDGAEAVYKLKLTTSASIALEKRLGKTTGDIMRQIGNFSVETARDVIHALLQKFHGKEFPNSPGGIEKVNDLIDDAGGIVPMIQLVAQAVGVKNEKEAQEAKDGPNPQDAQGGTGSASTLTLAESA